jgi:RNase P/RNase MRP subunit p30
MRRAYADLHLCVDTRDVRQASLLIGKAEDLGYRLVGIPFFPNVTDAEMRQARELCADAGLDLASRVDLRPRSPNDLLRSLRRLRRKFEVIAVLCESKTVARQAAKDRRVDLLSFPLLDYRRRFFDLAEGELASGALAALEVDMKPLLTLEGFLRARLLSSLRRETRIAKHFRVPLVISSGVSDALLLRKPMETAALTGLFELDHETALDGVSVNPCSILKRNRVKLSERFVAPGIRVVRKAKDC